MTNEKPRELVFTIHNTPHGFDFVYHMKDCFLFEAGEYRFIEHSAFLDLEAKLQIAVETLDKIDRNQCYDCDCGYVADNCLDKIKGSV